MKTVLTLLILIHAASTATYYLTLAPDIQTGSVDISSVFYPSVSYTFSATFLTPKTATYSHALSCSNLLHTYDNSNHPAIGRYSYLASMTASSSSTAISINAWTDNFLGSFVKKMAVLWLVVNSNFTYVDIAHYNYTSPHYSTSGTSFDNTTPIVGTVTTSFTMNSSDAIILVFSGLDILQNSMYYDVSIWAAYTYVNSTTIKLTFDQIMGQVCYAFVILTDIIVYHEAAFQANFNNATLDYGYSGNYLSTSSLSKSSNFTPYTASRTIDQTAFFYGLRHVNKMGTGASALNYTFTVSGSTLSLSIFNSHQQLAVAYINFAFTLTCAVNQLLNSTSKTCEACPLGTYADTVNNVCVACTTLDANCASCNSTVCITCNAPYYISGTVCTFDCSSILGCSNCSVVSAQIVCNTCATYFTLMNSTNCLLVCSNIDPNCNSCNTTACTSCNSPYYLGNSTSCICNCSSISDCATCSVVSSQIICNTCNTYFSLNSSTSCVLLCSNIDPNCNNCNSTACLGCTIPYYLASETNCSYNCTSITDCSTCSVVGALIVCNTCTTYYDLIAGTCVLNCANIDPNCNSCNSTACLGCNSPYYLVNNTACSYNCSSISDCATCSVVSAQIVCNTCATYFTLMNSTSCQLACSNIDPSCSSCNTTACTGCTSPYYLANNTACTYNCTSITGCDTCSVVNSQITCTVCSPNYQLDSSSNCTLICSNMIPNCNSCNLTDCFMCDTPYYLVSNTKCSFNCTSINGCSSCSVVNAQIECDACATGYQNDSSFQCSAICGDGLILGNEECDDGNTINGDGCSSTCMIQPNFGCNNTPSVCYLTKLNLDVICLVKDQLENKFTLTLHLKPQNLPIYSTANWMSIFAPSLTLIGPQRLLNQVPTTIYDKKSQITQINNQDYTTSVKTGAYILNPITVSYDPSSNRLRTLFEYYESLDGQIFTLGLSFSQLGSIFQNVVPFSVSFPQYTQNNLSLYAFSESHYTVAMAIKYLSFAIAGLSLILFVAGYFGAKLTAIECLGVVQITALLLLTLQKMSPAFGQLRYLNLALGVTGFPPAYFYQYSSLPVQANPLLSGRSPIGAVNAFWIFVIGPLICALILKILSITKCKEKKLIHDGWKYSLGTFTYYVFLVAYGQLASLALNLRYFDSQTQNYLGVAVGILFLVLLIVYIVMSHKNVKWFGSFKNKFYRFEISQFLYSFSAVERFLTPVLIVSVGPTFVGALIPCALFCIEILFICIKKPYIQKVGNRGPILKKASSVVICMLFACASFVSVQSTINMAICICIIVMLLMIVIFSCIVGGKQIYQNIKRLKEESQDQIRKYEDQILLTVQQSQKMILNQFKNKIMPKSEALEQSHLRSSSTNEQTENFDKAQWENYTALQNLKSRLALDDRIKEVGKFEEGLMQKGEDEQNSVDLQAI